MFLSSQFTILILMLQWPALVICQQRIFTQYQPSNVFVVENMEHAVEDSGIYYGRYAKIRRAGSDSLNYRSLLDRPTKPAQNTLVTGREKSPPWGFGRSRVIPKEVLVTETVSKIVENHEVRSRKLKTKTQKPQSTKLSEKTETKSSGTSLSCPKCPACPSVKLKIKAPQSPYFMEPRGKSQITRLNIRPVPSEERIPDDGGSGSVNNSLNSKYCVECPPCPSLQVNIEQDAVEGEIADDVPPTGPVPVLGQILPNPSDDPEILYPVLPGEMFERAQAQEIEKLFLYHDWRDLVDRNGGNDDYFVPSNDAAMESDPSVICETDGIPCPYDTDGTFGLPPEFLNDDPSGRMTRSSKYSAIRDEKRRSSVSGKSKD